MKKIITILIMLITSFSFSQQNARGIKDNGVKQHTHSGGCCIYGLISIGGSFNSPKNSNQKTFGKSTSLSLDYSQSLFRKSGFSIGFNLGGNYFFGNQNPFSSTLPLPYQVTAQISSEVSGFGSSKTSGYFIGFGPQFNIHFANHFIFSPIFQLGYVGLSNNEFTATQTTLMQGFVLPNYTRKYDLISQTETKTSGLGFIPKARVSYMFTPKFGLWAEASYLLGPTQENKTISFKPQGQPNAQGAYTIDQMDAGTYSTTTSESKYNTIGYNFGLSYGFGGKNKTKTNQNETKPVCFPIIKPQVDTIYCLNGKIYFYGKVIVETNGTRVSDLKLTSVTDKQGNNVLTDIKLPMKMIYNEPDFPFNFEIDKNNCGKDLVINFEVKSICISKTQQFQEIVTKGSITIPAKRIPCCKNSTSNSDDNDNKCENNPISNGDFTDVLIPGTMPIGTIKDWSVGYMDAKIGAPVVFAGLGFFDNGYVKLEGNKFLGNAIRDRKSVV